MEWTTTGGKIGGPAGEGGSCDRRQHDVVLCCVICLFVWSLCELVIGRLIVDEGLTGVKEIDMTLSIIHVLLARDINYGPMIVSPSIYSKLYYFLGT